MSIDQREFRNALGNFATGITVITTLQGETPVGVTINSFASVSLDPPLVLFSLKNDSAICDMIKTSGLYNVCMLSADQEEISNLFAGPGDQKFDIAGWSQGQNGAPVLNDTLQTLECKVHKTHKGGDHTIFVGEVTHISGGNDKAPLLYFRGAYSRL